MANFKLDVQQFFQSKRIGSNCNAITIINNSTTVPFWVNNIQILPQYQFVVEGNENEIDQTEYFVDMKGLQGECTVIKKMFV